MTRPGMPLEAKLPRNLGSCIGARIGDKFGVINSKNTTKIVPGMVFAVCMGLGDIPLTDVADNAKKRCVRCCW